MGKLLAVKDSSIDDFSEHTLKREIEHSCHFMITVKTVYIFCGMYVDMYIYIYIYVPTWLSYYLW